MAKAPPAGGADRQADKDRLVELLGQEWATMAQLLEDLPAPAWSTPALPGWDVHDVVAHVLGGERMLAGAAAPEIPEDLESAAHVRNPIARLNEAWVVSLRPLSPADMVEQFGAVTGERLAALRAMSVAEFNAPSWTPTGEGTYGRFMEIRLFDTWMHEQDVRVAVGVPGNEEGPAAELAVDEVAGALGYIVGKKAAAPQGSSIRISLTGPVHRRLCVVVDGKARVVDGIDADPTAEVALSSSLFLRLAGGRVEPETQLAAVRLTGDSTLGRQVVTHLAYTI
jgi:uncharacterized protein (TIGR03083 family)